MKTTALLKKINQALQVLEDARAFIEAQAESPVLAKSTAKPSTTKAAASKVVSKKQTTKRTMSEEGRARVAEAQRKRWAAAKKASKKQVK